MEISLTLLINSSISVKTLLMLYCVVPIAKPLSAYRLRINADCRKKEE